MIFNAAPIDFITFSYGLRCGRVSRSEWKSHEPHSIHKMKVSALLSGYEKLSLTNSRTKIPYFWNMFFLALSLSRLEIWIRYNIEGNHIFFRARCQMMLWFATNLYPGYKRRVFCSKVFMNSQRKFLTKIGQSEKNRTSLPNRMRYAIRAFGKDF